MASQRRACACSSTYQGSRLIRRKFPSNFTSPKCASTVLNGAIQRKRRGEGFYVLVLRPVAEARRTYQDLAALGVVEGVEAGEHAEAAAAVADDEADGAAPAEAGLAGRVLGGDVEVLVEVAVDAPTPARLHGALRLSPSRASRLLCLLPALAATAHQRF